VGFGGRGATAGSYLGDGRRAGAGAIGRGGWSPSEPSRPVYIPRRCKTSGWHRG